MPFSAADLSAVEAAIASGELVVRQGERMVQYRSMADLEKAREMILDDMVVRPPRQFRARVTKGL